MEVKNKITCLYHSSDLDGKCSAAIVYLAEQKNVELVGVVHDAPIPWDKISGYPVVMVDFSYYYMDMYEIQSKARAFTWIDHHKTAIDECRFHNFQAIGIQEVGRAACELAWEFYYSGRPVPVAVTLLGRYDVRDEHNQIYGWEEMILPFQMGMRNQHHEPTDQIWRELLFSDDALKIVPQLISEGRGILQYQRQENAKYVVAFSFETYLQEFRAIACNKGLTNSMLFDSVYDPAKHDLMITFCHTRKCWNVSLYSTKPEIDCGLIAKRFGGGGHKGAAGFHCDILPFKLGRV